MSLIVPSSAAQLFDEWLPNVLKKQVEKAKEIGGIYGFQLAGPGGGSWTIDLQAVEPSVTKGLHDVQCTIVMEHSDFITLLQNPSSSMDLFLQGKLKVQGNPMLAMRVQKLFAMGV